MLFFFTVFFLTDFFLEDFFLDDFLAPFFTAFFLDVFFLELAFFTLFFLEAAACLLRIGVSSIIASISLRRFSRSLTSFSTPPNAFFTAALNFLNDMSKSRKVWYIKVMRNSQDCFF
ncbi:hypothetical protein D6774_04020 [Candidatus Woesearchaeota archaeon]|nr:MAG: hypothetical protein D6774_04020 [Candidatus Woesearchaeota archaeon]